MGFFGSLFDDISTGLGSLAADINYEAAKSEARDNGIDVDELERKMYSKMGDVIEKSENEAEIEKLSQRLDELNEQIREEGANVDPQTIEEMTRVLAEIKQRTR